MFDRNGRHRHRRRVFRLEGGSPMMTFILIGFGMVILGMLGIRQISKYNARKYAAWDRPGKR
jgi:hypothetical protein